MEKIIDRAFLFSLVERISRPEPYTGQDPLFKLKQRFPGWIRRVIFSGINPLYVYYIYRNALRDRKELNYRMRNPFTVSFMTYCFRENYSLDLAEFYPEEDHPALVSYVENRVRSLFVDRLPVTAFSEEVGLEQKISGELKRILKQHKDGSCSWKLEGRTYFLSSRPEISAAYYKLGLPHLPVEALERLSGKVFIDGGAYNGDTSIALLPYHPSEIWCFEPDELNLELLHRTIERNELGSVLVSMKMGIGEQDSHASFTHSGIMGSKIEEDGDATIELRSIDSVVEERKSRIGLIKLDIEGFELEALRGSARTIAEQKPLLIISAYHTGKDFFEIPPLLKKLVPGYVLRFLDLEPLSPMLGEKMILAYAP